MVANPANVKWFGTRRRKGRPAAHTSIAALRIADLGRLFQARYGDTLPDDDAGRDDVAIMAHHLACTTRGNPVDRIRRWVVERAPWLTIAELEALIEDTFRRPRRWRADRLAWRLRLTEVDRAALHITTIGAIDMGVGQRSGRRRENNRKAKERSRRTRGVRPRHQYENGSAARTKPWTSLGMSRAKWYRLGKPSP